MVARLLIVVALAGCLKKLPAFSCEDSAQCGAGGVCEGNGLCSFVDGECASGRRFGDQQGELSNSCVGDGPAPDGGIDGPTCPDDLDCDLVLDAVDNCPTVANENQFNEDSDPRGDACDLCPPFDDNNEDADGDGVGDGCDPHPTSADTIVEFAGFREMPAGWTAMGGTFTIDNGDGVLSGISSQASRLMRATPAGMRYVIWAEATLASISPVALGAMGLGVLHEPGTDDIGGLCQLVGLANGTMEELRLFNTGNGGAILLDSGAHTFDPSTTYELYLEHDDGFLSCDASNPDLGTEAATTFAPANPELGLRVRSASARYHWVMVLSTN